MYNYIKILFVLTIIIASVSQESRGQYNTIYGTGAGNSGSLNTSFGYYAGHNITGSSNTFMGEYAGYSSNAASNNLFYGINSGYYNSTGSNNVFVGSQAGYNSDNNYSTYVGGESGYTTLGGYNNSFLGYRSGYNHSGAVGGGSYRTQVFGGDWGNVFIGYYAGATSSGVGKLHIDSNPSTAAPLIWGRFYDPAVGINTVASYLFQVQYAYCDGYSWFNASDKNLKENFKAISTENFLDKIGELKIERWNYKGDNEGISHVGPYSEDFNKIFGFNDKQKGISTVDEIGISLAAIQQIGAIVDSLDMELNAQKELISAEINNPFKYSLLTGASFSQNDPNPFGISTNVHFVVPEGVVSAEFELYNLEGKLINRQLILERGEVKLSIMGNELSPGLYVYTLITDGISNGVKKMIVIH